MKLIMSPYVVMLGLLMVAGVTADESKTAVKVVLGGEWFTSTTTGEANGYLMSDFKTKVLEPILKRIANHVYSNHGELSILRWLMGLLGAWVELVSAFVAFKHQCGCKGYSKIIQSGRTDQEIPHSGPSRI